MANIQYTIRRYEKKYLQTRDQFGEIRQALVPYMTDDEYGLHTIKATIPQNTLPPKPRFCPASASSTNTTTAILPSP